MANGDALPGWIVWDNTDGLTITPTDGSLMASNPYSIAVVYTPTDGANNPAYTVLDITVTCDVTQFAMTNAPADDTYTIFDTLKVIRLDGVTFTQEPTCGYGYTLAYTYSTSPSVTFITGGTVFEPSVEIYSADGSDAAAAITVTMATAVTMDGGTQAVTSLNAPSVSFDVAVTNPCIAATIDDLVFSPSTISVTDGGTGTATFSIP